MFDLSNRNSMQLDDSLGLDRRSPNNLDSNYLGSNPNDYGGISPMQLSTTPNSSNRRMSGPPSPFFSLTPTGGMRSSIPSPMMNGSMDSTTYSSLSTFILHRNSFGMGYGRNSLSLSNPRSSISGARTSFSLNPHRDSFSTSNAIFSAFPNTPTNNPDHDKSSM